MEVTLDPKALVKDLNAFVEKQLPFATANAMNRSAEEAQERVRFEIHAKFAVRTPASAQFLERLVKIDRGDRATKERLVARLPIAAGPNVDPKRVDLLIRHIQGGTHARPGTALDSFFIPAHATRPSPMTVVPRSLYPKSLRLMDRRGPSETLHAKRRVTSTGKVQIIGKQRTFVLTDKATGRPYGVYQRDGKHRSDIQLIWLYSKRITIKRRFDFYGIAQRTFLERWPINFQGMLDAAMRTAR